MNINKIPNNHDEMQNILKRKFKSIYERAMESNFVDIIAYADAMLILLSYYNNFNDIKEIEEERKMLCNVFSRISNIENMVQSGKLTSDCINIMINIASVINKQECRQHDLQEHGHAF